MPCSVQDHLLHVGDLGADRPPRRAGLLVLLGTLGSVGVGPLLDFQHLATFEAHAGNIGVVQQVETPEQVFVVMQAGDEIVHLIDRHAVTRNHHAGRGRFTSAHPSIIGAI